MHDPSARITRVEVCLASPGCCAICGKSQHPDGFADTANLDFEFYGSFYLCADCVGDYARLFGYLAPTDVSKLQDQLDAQEKELLILREAILGMEATIDVLIADAYRRDTRVVTDATYGVASGVLVNPVDEQDAQPTDVAHAEPDRVSDDAEQQSDGPADEQGRDNVHNVNDVNELLGL